MRRRRFLAATGCLVATAGCTQTAQDPAAETAADGDTPELPAGAWPQVGYDARKTSAPTDRTGPRGEVEVAWTALGDRPLFRPVVDDALYLTERWTDGAVLSLRERDGGRRWTRSSIPPVRWPPALASGHVFVLSRTEDNEVKLRALDPDSGDRLWSTPVPGPASSSRYGSVGPTVRDGRVYVPSNTGVRAFEASGGTERWAAELNSHVVEKENGGIWRTDWATPAVDARRVYTYDLNDDYRSAREVYAVDRTTGAEVWTTTLDLDQGWALAGHPVVGPDRLFLRALKPAGGPGGETGEQEWGGQNRLYARSVETGEVAWERTLEWKVLRAPAYAGGTVYVGTWDPPTEAGRLYALDAADGSTQWTYRTEVGGVGRPAVTAGRVYIRQGSELAAVRREDGTADWRLGFDVPVRDPVVTGGSVYGLVPSAEDPERQRVVAVRERS